MASSFPLSSTRVSLLHPPPIRSRRFLAPTTSRFLDSAAVAKTLRMRSIHNEIVKVVKASSSGVTPSSSGDDLDGLLEAAEVDTINNSSGTSFIAKLAIAIGIAATVALLYLCARWSSSGTSYNLPVLEGSSQPSVSPAGFTLTIFEHRLIIPEYTPGWVYFWLLMAAGCGLFISEEALNIWVGISLARTLTLNGSWESFASSFSRNCPYIISTVLWVYWGVCVSDLIPFYLGNFFRKTKASQSICTKLGIGRERAVKITQVVRRYGNLIGFVERFSVGVRNPTAFLAGALGISSECFFAGVCCGGLVTLPVQLALGFLLRERPAVALASVATVVGIWTVFPYIVAASTALYLFFRRNSSDQYNNHSQD